MERALFRWVKAQGKHVAPSFRNQNVPSGAGETMRVGAGDRSFDAHRHRAAVHHRDVLRHHLTRATREFKTRAFALDARGKLQM